MVGRPTGRVDDTELTLRRQLVGADQRLDHVEAAESPPARSVRPFGPYERFASACVAIAPVPAEPQGTACPTARHFEATATPQEAVSGSKAAIEKVIVGLLFRGLCRPLLAQPDV